MVVGQAREVVGLGLYRHQSDCAPFNIHHLGSYQVLYMDPLLFIKHHYFLLKAWSCTYS